MNAAARPDETTQLAQELASGRLTRDRLAIAAFFGHRPARALVAVATPWPAPDAVTLYRWASQEMADLGKEVCMRVVLARHVTPGVEREFDRQARHAAEAWTIEPTEERRKHAGRLAATHQPHYSLARVLANMAGAKSHWRTAVGWMVTGNPNVMSAEALAAVSRAIEVELIPWALGQRDVLAERHRRELDSAA